MAFKHGHGFLSFVFLLPHLLLVVCADPDEAPSHIDEVKRSNFPKDFVFGTSSSAYQVEGAAFIDGKGQSVWDNYTHQYPERIKNNSNGDVAIDQYHRYKGDVAIMKNIGFGGYRFSIAWSRVLPKGKVSGGVNKKGIGYYNSLINELLANGVQPFVTLFHWDLPQALQDEYQGFLNYQIVQDFQDYAELCFKEFGDRVKHWITLNEPLSYSAEGYASGVLPPGRCTSPTLFNSCFGGDSGTEPYTVSHHEILAHAVAAKLYKTKYQAQQKGVIGISLNSYWYLPYANDRADRKAVERGLDFGYGWFLHPLTYGDYPHIMRELVKDRLPKFNASEINLIKGSLDFLGINYYSGNYAKNDPHPPGPPSYLTDSRATYSDTRVTASIGSKEEVTSSLDDYPPGIYDLLMYTKKKYKSPIIYITENGYLTRDGPIEELLKDEGRIQYHKQHLYNLHRAIKDHARVKGYFAWSLFDNFEWIFGYTYRFGINYIDYKKNLTRIPKLSAKWFQDFLKT